MEVTQTPSQSLHLSSHVRLSEDPFQQINQEAESNPEISSLFIFQTNDHPFFKQEARLGPVALATASFHAACISN